VASDCLGHDLAGLQQRQSNTVSPGFVCSEALSAACVECVLCTVQPCSGNTGLVNVWLLLLCRVQANEIDVALLDLLQQNIEAARTAGQEEPAKFMEKVRQAAMKFMVTPA